MTPTFEESYVRLEEILQKISGTAVSLEDSLKLYEEADKLITLCQKRLQDAEQKIEILMKNRDGTLALDEKRQPLKQPFAPTTT